MFRISKNTLWVSLLLLLGVAVLVVPIIVNAQGTTTATAPAAYIAPQTVWDFISQREWIKTIWRFSLGLVDIVVVVGLVIAAFSNIFRINLKSYEIKQVLPGLIIGIILANLSYFIMQFMLQAGSISVQLVAEMVGNVINMPAGTEHGGSFIMRQLGVEMQLSITHFPAINLGGVAVVAAGAIGAQALGAPAVGIVIVILLLIFALGPYIVYYVLLFLLYVRNFVLIVAFMTAPLAFFALGFPPFRAMWQKWWGTFWKWLLMALVAHIVLAMGLIFLHFANVGIKGGAGERGLVEYFFVNGIGIALLYFATRIPFMWGSLFGLNAMKEWAKLGKEGAKLGHSGLKATTDKVAIGGGQALFRKKAGNKLTLINPKSAAANNLAAIQDRYSKANAGYLKDQQRASIDAKVQKIMKGPGGAEAANRFVNSALAKEHAGALSKAGTDARNKFNIFRAPETLQAGWKERTGAWKTDEEKAIKQNKMFGYAAGPEAQDRLDMDRYDSTVKELDDERELWEQVEPLQKAWKGGGCDTRSLMSLFDKGNVGFLAGRNTDQCLQRAIAWSKLHDGGRVTSESVKEMKSHGNRLFKVMRDQNVRGLVASKLEAAMVANTADKRTLDEKHKDADRQAKQLIKGKSEAFEYALDNPKDVFAFAGSGAGGQYGFVDDDDDAGHTVIMSPSQLSIQKMLTEQGSQATAEYAKSIIKTMPHTAIAASQEAYRASQRELQRALTSQGLDDTQAKAMVLNIYERIQKKMGGITASELDAQAGKPLDHASLVPHIEAYRDRTKDMNQVLHQTKEFSSPSAADMPINGHIAEHINTQVKGNIDLAREQLEAVLNETKVAHDTASLQAAYKNVSALTGDIGLTVDGGTSAGLREAIEKNVQRAQEAVKLLESPTVASARQAQDPQVLSQAIERALNEKMMAHHAVVSAAQTADHIDAEHVAGAISDTIRRTVVDYSTDLKKQYEAAADAERKQYDTVIAEVSSKLQDSFQESQKAGKKAHEAINENNEAKKIDLRDYMERALREGFARVRPPQGGGAAAPESGATTAEASDVSQAAVIESPAPESISADFAAPPEAPSPETPPAAS